jgi:hypothetical protein
MESEGHRTTQEFSPSSERGYVFSRTILAGETRQWHPLEHPRSSCDFVDTPFSFLSEKLEWLGVVSLDFVCVHPIVNVHVMGIIPMNNIKVLGRDHK